MGYDYLKDVVEGFNKRLKQKRENPATPKSSELATELMCRYWDMVHNARKEGKPLAWASFGVPIEVFYAMDIVPFLVEQFAVTTVVQGLRQGKGWEFFDYGVRSGFAKDGCTAHIVCLGMAQADVLPPPDFIVCASVPCDSSCISFDILAEWYKCPSFFYDYPLLETADSLRCYKSEFYNLIQFLEDQTKRKIDWDKFREVIEISKRTNEYYAKVLELRKTVPCPMGGRDGWTIITNIRYCDGMPLCLEYFKSLSEELQAKVDKGEGWLPEERHRLMWIGGWPFTWMGIVNWMEEDFKAVIVGEAQNAVKHTLGGDLGEGPEEIIDFLSRKIKGASIWRIFKDFDTISEELLEQLEEYKVDGAVYYASTGCKQGCNLTRLLKDVWGSKVPTMIVDGDILDPRIVPLDRQKEQVRNFLLILEGG